MKRMVPVMVLAMIGAVCCKSGKSSDDSETDSDVSPADTTEMLGDVSDTLDEGACTTDEDCDDDDPCTADSCNTVDTLCVNVDVDADNDGYAAAMVGETACGGTDCDDDDDTVWPGAPLVCDGEDHDCNDVIDRDEDGDGYDSASLCPGAGDDCDDTNADANPGETTDCANTFDSDCDGVMDCAVAGCDEVDCPCTTLEWMCEGGGDEDCDDDVDCDDADCIDPCACSGGCSGSDTCCSHGCCDTQDDPACCGGCGPGCEDDQMCCDGDCAECCDHVDCDDANICTADSCESGVCVHDFSTTDMSPCPAGVCCSGVCVAGGDCCADTDCGCKGTASPCSTVVDGAVCALQSGCTWDDQSCFDPTGVPCTDLTGWDCEMKCTNCATWTPSLLCGLLDYSGITWCEPFTPCAAIGNPSDCEACECTWSGSTCVGPPNCSAILDAEGDRCDSCPTCYRDSGAGVCSGMHPSCNTYGSADCNNQAGCGWLPTCTSNNCTG